MSAYHFFGVKFYMDLIIFFNTLFGFFTFVAWAISALILYFIFTKKRFTKLINDQFYNFATSVAHSSVQLEVLYTLKLLVLFHVSFAGTSAI